MTILHPKHENPCPVAHRNPAELLLMGANPQQPKKRNPEEMYLIRWHTGNHSQPFDTREQAEAMLQKFHGAGEVVVCNPRFTNPGGLASVENDEAEAARDLREGFAGTPSEKYRVTSEPHVPSGDYTAVGKFLGIAIKPTPSGELSTVQEISFPGQRLEWISNAAGDQLYIVGGDVDLSETELGIFTSERRGVILLGEARGMSYGMKKFGSDVAPSARGEYVQWDHAFGEEGGSFPAVHYDTNAKRLLIGKASYRIQGAWVRN